ncbi:MAG: hypothetical protein WCV67_12180 [Victivallaceae bacterium]|jgi:hypothetical protein
MRFIDAYFLVNFLPFGLMSLAGVLLFFKGKYKQEKWYYPLFFIVIVLTVTALWRVPVVDSTRRYAMPIMVTGIVLSAFVLMLLPGILKKFKISHANAVTRVFTAALLIACVAKAMRPQENKDYLHEIAEVIKLDCQKSNINRNVALLVFGNPGGHLNFDNNIEVINVKNEYWGCRFANAEYQCPQLNTSLNIDVLKSQYPHLYLLCVEPVHDNFRAAWEKQYSDNPELIFEYISRKQTAYRLYRIKSPHKIAWTATDEFKSMLANKDDLFRNGDFKKKYRVSSEDNIAKDLLDRGIDLFGNGDVYLPDGWRINTGDGWNANCSPVSIKLTAGNTNALNIQSKNMVSLYSNKDTLNSNKFYLVAVRADSKTQGCLILSAYTYNIKDEFIRPFVLKEIKLSNQKNSYLIPFMLKNCEKIRLGLIFSGNVTIDNVKVISME